MKNTNTNTNKYLEWDSTYKFIGDIYGNFQNFLSTLSGDQMLAFGHMLGLITIFFCLMSMISVFAGDSLIKYFKIEERLPKLARYIQFRRKFQQYYFYFNALIIIILLIFLVYANLMLFIYR